MDWIDWMLIPFVYPILWATERARGIWTFFQNRGACPMCGSRRTEEFDRFPSTVLCWCRWCRNPFTQIMEGDRVAKVYGHPVRVATGRG